MKKLFFSLLIIPFFAVAQTQDVKTETSAGVHFIHKVTNWDDIIAQAKKENKFVFVDCYTTWCGPCKYVSSKVFPMKNVGDFFNKNFISVGLQIDQIKKDNEDVIATRPVAKKIEKDYKIEAYPTFLIFDNTGKLVHKFIGAGDDKMMIENAQAALTKDGQYFTLLEEYKAGNKDAAFIGKLCTAANKAGEKNNEFLKTFINSNDNIFTKENGEILLNNITTADAPAFNHLYSNKMVWLQILDKTKFEEKIKNGVFSDILEYIGKQQTRSINWSDVESTFKTSYPEYSAEQVAKAKVVVNLNFEDWAEYESSLKNLINNYPSTIESIKNSEMLNALAWGVFENIDDKSLLNYALAWSKKSLAKEENMAFLDTYANLLYKLGQTKEAIEQETKALTNTTDAEEKKQYLDTIDKMKAGKKTWK